MTEDREDYLGLDDPVEKAAQRPPAFICGPPLGNAEILIAERVYLESQRDPQFLGANEILFIDGDNEGNEYLSLPEATKWAAIMGWPPNCRCPTLEEIEQFQKARETALHRKFWAELQAAAIKDDEDAAAAEQKRSDAIVAGIRTPKRK
jgi:hypothetical protein